MILLSVRLTRCEQWGYKVFSQGGGIRFAIWRKWVIIIKEREKKEMKNVIKFEKFINGLDDADLGKLVKEYIGESNNGGWEGYEKRDFRGIINLMKDMKLYKEMMDDGVV